MPRSRNAFDRHVRQHGRASTVRAVLPPLPNSKMKVAGFGGGGILMEPETNCFRATWYFLRHLLRESSSHAMGAEVCVCREARGGRLGVWGGREVTKGALSSALFLCGASRHNTNLVGDN